MYKLMILGLVFIISCDTRDNIFETENATPTAQVQPNNSWNNGELLETFVDSVKVGYEYKYNVLLNNDNEFINYTINQSQNFNHSYYKEGINKSILVTQRTNEKSLSLIVSSNNAQINYVTISFFDDYKKQFDVEYILTSFYNLVPFSSFSVNKKIGSSIPLEYTFDASGSRDRDSKYGGQIEFYNYDIINSDSTFNHTIYTNKASVDFIFPSPGTYTITLKAKDNDKEFGTNDNKVIVVS